MVVPSECYIDIEDLNRDRMLEILEKYGFLIVNNVVIEDKCDDYVNSIWTWMEGLQNSNPKAEAPKIRRDDPNTWVSREKCFNRGLSSYNWPSNGYGIISFYGIAHADFVWRARCEQNIRKIYSTVWQTNELLVSFDGVCAMLPNSISQASSTSSWFHFDQSPKKNGLHCVQGFLNLQNTTESDGCFMVYPSSNQLHQQFFQDKGLFFDYDWYAFNQQNRGDEWFLSKGFQPLKIIASKGSMVLWDSRTAHCSSLPTSNNLRYAIYICMLPRAIATEEQIAEKKRIFQERLGTNHWPHQNEVQYDESLLLQEEEGDDQSSPAPRYEKSISVEGDIQEINEETLRLVGYTEEEIERIIQK